MIAVMGRLRACAKSRMARRCHAWRPVSITTRPVSPSKTTVLPSGKRPSGKVPASSQVPGARDCGCGGGGSAACTAAAAAASRTAASRITLLAGDDANHLQALVRVAPLVVVPAHQLDEGGVEGDAGVGVEDRGAGVAAEVGGHNLVFRVAQDALERAFALRLHFRADFGIGR